MYWKNTCIYKIIFLEVSVVKVCVGWERVCVVPTRHLVYATVPSRDSANWSWLGIDWLVLSSHDRDEALRLGTSCKCLPSYDRGEASRLGTDSSFRCRLGTLCNLIKYFLKNKYIFNKTTIKTNFKIMWLVKQKQIK